MPVQSGWITWFIRNPVAANLLMAIVLVAGVSSIATLRTEDFPEMPPRSLVVSLPFEGGTPAIVEAAVALDVERALAAVPGIYRLRVNVTARGMTADVLADEGVALSDLTESVRARIGALTDLPTLAGPLTVVPAVEEQRVINVQVAGAVSHRTLKAVARRVRERLLSLDAVGTVSTEGERAAEMRIEVDPRRLDAFGLAFSDVTRAVGGSAVFRSAGRLHTAGGPFSLQVPSSASPQALAQIVVSAPPGGRRVLLGDVASVSDGFAEPATFSLFDGVPSVNLAVLLSGRESVLETAAAVHDELARLQAAPWLPRAVRLVAWGDEADSVRDGIALLAKSAALGMVLVFLMLAVFVHPKVAVWVALGVPVSFAGAFFVMGPAAFDYSVNTLTLFGLIIALGLVVDDAIIIGESVHAHARVMPDGAQAAIRGAQSVAVPATFGVLTTVATFLPLTFVDGYAPTPFRMVAVVTIACLLFSLLESRLVLPAHLAGTTLRRSGEAAPGLLQRARGAIDHAIDLFTIGAFRRALRLALRHRYQTVLGFVSLLVLSVGLVTSGLLGFVFFDDENDALVYSRVRLAPSAALAETRDAARLIGTRARDVATDLAQGATSPVRHVHLLATGTTSARVVVQLVPGTERAFTSQDFLDRWRETVGPLGGARELTFFIDDDESEDLRIELSGVDRIRLREAAESLATRVRGLPGLRDVRIDADNVVGALAFSLRPEARALGFTEREVSNQVRGMTAGVEARRLQRHDEEVVVRVRYPVRHRDDVGDVGGWILISPEGVPIALAQVADVHRGTVETKRSRIDRRPVMAVSAQVDKRRFEPDEIVEQLEASVLAGFRATWPDISIHLAGEEEDEERATGRLARSFALGLFLAYGLLAVALRSWAAPLVILCAVPFGIVGALTGHLVVGIPLGFLSWFGIIALSGVVMNDALVLVHRFMALRRDESLEEAVLGAGCSRLRAVVLTSLTTFVGLLPLLFERSEQAMTLIPMAVSLAFGILFATAITLFLVPALLGIRDDWLCARAGRAASMQAVATRAGTRRGLLQ